MQGRSRRHSRVLTGCIRCGKKITNETLSQTKWTNGRLMPQCLRLSSERNLYIRLHSHIHTCAHMHTFTHTCVHMHTQRHPCIHRNIHAHTHWYTCKHIHTYIYTHMHTHSHKKYIHIPYAHTHAHIYTHKHTHIHTESAFNQYFKPSLSTINRKKVIRYLKKTLWHWDCHKSKNKQEWSLDDTVTVESKIKP